MGQLRKVKNVILTARTERGVIALVVFHDDRYGITRDEQQLPEHHWTTDQLDECIETFMRMSNGQAD